MVIKLLQQSTFRRYAASNSVITIFFYFCCFRCVIVPLTGVLNYVFLHLSILKAFDGFPETECFLLKEWLMFTFHVTQLAGLTLNFLGGDIFRLWRLCRREFGVIVTWRHMTSPIDAP